MLDIIELIPAFSVVFILVTESELKIYNLQFEQLIELISYYFYQFEYIMAFHFLNFKLNYVKTKKIRKL